MATIKQWIKTIIPQYKRLDRHCLFDFTQKQAFNGWKTWSDKVYKGESTATFKPAFPFETSETSSSSQPSAAQSVGAEEGRTKPEENYAMFYGSTSTRIPGNQGKYSGDRGANRKVVRLGFSACRAWIPWYMQNIHDFNKLEIMLRSDGRRYSVNINPKSFATDDLYQGYLECHPEDRNQWVVATIPLKDLVLLGRGRVKTYQRAFDQGCIEAIGFSIADKQNGDYRLDIKQITLLP